MLIGLSNKEGLTMLTKINIHSSVAVYAQIENEIQFAIASGKLKAGDKLPAVRELSERYGINPNTVVKSYRDLEVMGLLYTRRGMGVYVEKGVAASCKARCYRRTIERLHEVVQEAKAAGMKKGKLVAALNKSFAAKGSPYGDVPKAVLALAKGK